MAIIRSTSTGKIGLHSTTEVFDTITGTMKSEHRYDVVNTDINVTKHYETFEAAYEEYVIQILEALV